MLGQVLGIVTFRSRTHTEVSNTLAFTACQSLMSHDHNYGCPTVSITFFFKFQKTALLTKVYQYEQLFKHSFHIIDLFFSNEKNMPKYAV